MKISLLIAIVLFMSACNEQQETEKTEPANTPAETISPQQKTTADKTVLIGDWMRTDADYRIQVSELLSDGWMKAGYFNPKSINVGKAMWSSADGVLKVFIELRDENYPGSSYTLTYLPESDLLAGKYYQAVEGATYDVEFTRKK